MTGELNGMRTTQNRRAWWCSPGAALVAALMAMPAEPTAQAQERGTVTTVAIGAGSSRDAAAALEQRVTEMRRTGELVRVSDAPDPLAPNRRHEYLAQFHQGVRVQGGGLTRQLIGTELVSSFGTLFEDIRIAVTPRMTGVAVINQAQTDASSPVVEGSSVTLAIVPLLDGGYRLTYRATFSDGQIRYLDADTGAVVKSEDAISFQSAVGSGTGVHGDRKKISVTRSGSGFEARDQLRPAQIVTRTVQGTPVTLDAAIAGAGAVGSDADNVWVNPALVDAHVNAGLTYDYFHQRHDWRGMDGSSGTITQVVADRATLDTNALFAQPTATNPGGLLAYGVASTGVPITPLDIVGHEVMHGVTFFSLTRRTGQGLSSGLIFDGTGPTAALSGNTTLACTQAVLVQSDGTEAPFFCQEGRYVLASGQSGAINEGFSDVFGAAIEFAHQPSGTTALSADYTIGEDVSTGGSAGSASWRSLVDPGTLAVESTGTVRYPDHYDNRIRYPLVVVNNLLLLAPFPIVNGRFIFVGTDGGAVHWNATLMGHVYYLAVEGGTNRTSGRVVQGVGADNRSDIERVFFRAMNTLMPQAPTFPVAAAAIRQAAVDLFGSGSTSFRAIDQALGAVGL
jgi:Zn-dependent metalloprotease